MDPSTYFLLFTLPVVTEASKTEGVTIVSNPNVGWVFVGFMLVVICVLLYLSNKED
jgi:hypothetical protein